METTADDDNQSQEPRLNNIEFSTEVQYAIDQVLQSADPLDSPDFNPIDYINQLFPNEQSLSNIDEIITSMECEISIIDDNIRSVVRGQTNTGQDGRMALEEAKKVINQLFSQITEIKTRAEKTEEMVKEITRDIKQLDWAKKNLTSAITTLNHLHMLVGGVESLSKLSEKRQYGEILNPLQAITEVNQHFQQYNDIPQIKNLSNQVEQIQKQLAMQITEDFHNGFSPTATGSVKMSLNQLTDACKVVSVLDSKVKRDLLKWFISLQLEEYVQLFHENQDIAWLDKIHKRYVWLKRHLLDFEDKFGKIFPIEWEVSERITVQFCLTTRDELARIMNKRRNEIDVKLLLFAINKTQNFEQLLAKRFTGSTLEDYSIPAPVDTSTSMPAALQENGADLTTEHENITSTITIAKPSGFDDLIGSCFKSHLDIYIDSVDRNLAELIEKFIEASKQPFNTVEAKSTVFPSCADLFVFYKKCMSQCMQLSNGKPMYDLAMIFKKYLREYAAKVLEANIPKVATVQTSIGTSMAFLARDLQNLSTAAGHVITSLLKDPDFGRFSPTELIRICCILTSSEYCLETVYQLEEKLKERTISIYADKLDLSEERDVFHRIISTCIQMLVQDLENGCESALSIMSKTQWQTINNVGDQSNFVNMLITEFKRTIPIIRDNLVFARKFFAQFCHRFINLFIPKYINALYKCRPINSSDGSNNILGCEQLLLDTHSLKTVLLDLPSIGSNVNRIAPTSYTKAVVKGMSRAEMIIKVLMVPLYPAVSFNEQVLKLIPESTLSEYQKVLDMKGVKRMDQIHLLDLHRKSTTGQKNSSVPQNNPKSIFPIRGTGGGTVRGDETQNITNSSSSESITSNNNILPTPHGGNNNANSAASTGINFASSTPNLANNNTSSGITLTNNYHTSNASNLSNRNPSSGSISANDTVLSGANNNVSSGSALINNSLPPSSTTNKNTSSETN